LEPIWQNLFFAAGWLGGYLVLFFLILSPHPPTGQTAVKKRVLPNRFQELFYWWIGGKKRKFNYIVLKIEENGIM